MSGNLLTDWATMERKRLAAVAACLAVGLLGVVGGVASATPAEGGPIAALFPPWWPQERAMAAAASAGSLAGAGPGGSIWVVVADRPGLAGRLRAAGAVLLLDPAVWRGCLTSPPPVAAGQEA